MTADTRPTAGTPDPLATLLHDVLNDDRACIHSPENEWEPLCEELARAAGVTLTQPKPDAVPDVVACRPCLDTMNASHPGGWNAPHVASHPHDGHAYDGCKCVCCLNVRAIRSTPAAPATALREALRDYFAAIDADDEDEVAACSAWLRVAIKGDAS